MYSKTFRLFVSSTFNDFRKERIFLQTKLFPYIQQYCLKLGYTFQHIDLRWGVTSEAQLQQNTLALCLNEVRASKAYPYPNFLMMVGDRYGWIPLPQLIEKSEFESLLGLVTESEKSSLLNWYKKDLNQVPNAYLLKERTGEFTAPEKWEAIEQQMRQSLQVAAKRSKLTAIQQQKYFTSATEAEVIEGVFSYAQLSENQRKLLKEEPKLSTTDASNIFGFFRSVDLSSKCSEKFITHYYDRAQLFKKDVKASLVEENILDVYTTQLDEDALDETYLKSFALRTMQFLETKIKEQVQRDKQSQYTPLEEELAEQSSFIKLKSKNFTG